MISKIELKTLNLYRVNRKSFVTAYMLQIIM